MQFSGYVIVALLLISCVGAVAAVWIFRGTAAELDHLQLAHLAALAKSNPEVKGFLRGLVDAGVHLDMGHYEHAVSLVKADPAFQAGVLQRCAYQHLLELLYPETSQGVAAQAFISGHQPS